MAQQGTRIASKQVSGKQDLIYQGQVDTSALGGSPGTLLLDLENITIIAGGSGYGSNDRARDNDQLELVVITAKGQPVRRLVAGATRAQVLKTIQRFLNEITDPRKVRTTSYLPFAQQLYRWLVAQLKPN